MRFLLELVSCCGCQESFCGGGDGGGTSPVPESPSSESNRLVPVARRSFRRRRRGRTAGGDFGGRSSGEWKPSLFAISEDNVVIERQTSDSDGAVKRKSGSFKPDKIRLRTFSKDFGFVFSLAFLFFFHLNFLMSASVILKDKSFVCDWLIIN